MAHIGCRFRQKKRRHEADEKAADEARKFQWASDGNRPWCSIEMFSHMRSMFADLDIACRGEGQRGKRKERKEKASFCTCLHHATWKWLATFFLLQLPKRAVPESQQRAAEDKGHPQSNERSEQILCKFMGGFWKWVVMEYAYPISIKLT